MTTRNLEYDSGTLPLVEAMWVRQNTQWRNKPREIHTGASKFPQVFRATPHTENKFGSQTDNKPLFWMTITLNNLEI